MVGPHLSGFSGCHVGTRGDFLESSGPSKLAEPWRHGALSCLTNWNVKTDQNIEKRHARASEGNLGPQNPYSACSAPWPLLMRSGARRDSSSLPSLSHDGEPGQCLTRLLPHQKKPELGSCPIRKSLFCIVRAPGEARTWSCPDGGPRPHPENHKSTAQACPCQGGHVSRSAAEPPHGARTLRILPANEALARSRLIRPPWQQELPPCKVTSILRQEGQGPGSNSLHPGRLGLWSYTGKGPLHALPLPPPRSPPQRLPLSQHLSQHLPLSLLRSVCLSLSSSVSNSRLDFPLLGTSVPLSVLLCPSVSLLPVSLFITSRPSFSVSLSPQCHCLFSVSQLIGLCLSQSLWFSQPPPPPPATSFFTAWGCTSDLLANSPKCLFQGPAPQFQVWAFFFFTLLAQTASLPKLQPACHPNAAFCPSPVSTPNGKAFSLTKNSNHKNKERKIQ